MCVHVYVRVTVSAAYVSARGGACVGVGVRELVRMCTSNHVHDFIGFTKAMKREGNPRFFAAHDFRDPP
jgi:hypothetical protein